MPVTADSTIIAHALATSRALSRAVMIRAGRKALEELASRANDASVDGLAALKRLEAGQ